MEELNTEYKDLPICPYCNTAQVEYWELDDEECGEVTCGSCEKTYEYVRHVDIRFSTKRIEKVK